MTEHCWVVFERDGRGDAIIGAFTDKKEADAVKRENEHGRYIQATTLSDSKAREEEKLKLVDELRAATAYPFNPARKMSNKARYEECLNNIAEIATRLEIESKALTASKQDSEGTG